MDDVPSNARRPRAAEPPRRRRMIAPLMVLSVAFAATMVFVQERITARHRMLHRYELRVDPVRMAVRSLQAEVRRWADLVERASDDALAELRELDGSRVSLPADLPLYCDQIERMCRAAPMPAGLAERLARQGHPMFVAAVCVLQQGDYRRFDVCAQAANVHRFLENTTGVHGLAVLPPEGGDVTHRETCRFAAAANAWRELTEQHCATEELYEAFLRATGKSSAQ